MCIFSLLNFSAKEFIMDTNITNLVPEGYRTSSSSSDDRVYISNDGQEKKLLIILGEMERNVSEGTISQSVIFSTTSPELQALWKSLDSDPWGWHNDVAMGRMLESLVISVLLGGVLTAIFHLWWYQYQSVWHWWYHFAIAPEFIGAFILVISGYDYLTKQIRNIRWKLKIHTLLRPLEKDVAVTFLEAVTKAYNQRKAKAAHRILKRFQ